jgi:hypothetical protein
MSIINTYIPQKDFVPSYVIPKGFFTEPKGVYVIPAVKKKHLEMFEQIITKHWNDKNISKVGVGIIAYSLYNWMKKYLKQQYQKESEMTRIINLMYQNDYFEALLDLQENDLNDTKNLMIFNEKYKEFSNYII